MRVAHRDGHLWRAGSALGDNEPLERRPMAGAHRACHIQVKTAMLDKGKHPRSACFVRAARPDRVRSVRRSNEPDELA